MLTPARLFLRQIALSESLTQLMLVSTVDDPRTQPGSLSFTPDAWQVTAGFPLFLPPAGSSVVSPSIFFTSSSSGWELIQSLTSRAAILALVCFAVGLMPCYLHSFLTYICCSLVIEFQTSLGYFLHSTFPINAATLGLTDWLLVFAIWTDCMSKPFFMTIWPR